MVIGIIGTGNVGGALGTQLVKKHEVVFGSRHPRAEKVKALLATLLGARAASISEAVSVSDVVILATPGMRSTTQAQHTAQLLGPGAAGKVVIDATNPLSPWPALDVLWDGTSGGELLQQALPQSHVFKAFNTIGYEHMLHPTLAHQQLTMLIAGPSEHKAAAEQVVADVGFVPIHVGPIRYARNLEALAELWIHLAVPGAGAADHPRFGSDRAFHLQLITGG